jgi:hypothetical protein
MKYFLMGAVSAVALFAAGGAMAAGNSSDIQQIGTSNNASVDQTAEASDGVVSINQSDSYNTASATQGGAGNQASVTQSNGSFGAVTNPSNQSTSNQQGQNGAVTVVQVGNSTSNITQYGNSSNEHALVGQSGNGDNSTISQAGASELAMVNQELGTGNSASISQAGIGSADFAPHNGGIAGGGNLRWNENVPSDSVLPGAHASLTTYGPTGATIDQLGTNETGAITQGGYQNFADVAQGNDAGGLGNNGSIAQGAGMALSDAVMFQDGQYNTASISQQGFGSSYSTIWQHGVSNQAYSTQTGSQTSTIQQGFVDDNTNEGAAVSGDYANVNQSGGGNNSVVNQSGNNDWASVSQVNANATSTISQGGSFNVATVHQ